MMSRSAGNEDVDETLHAIFEANRLLRDAGEKLASEVGQTHSRRMILNAAGNGLSVADIARSLGLKRQGVQRVADELVHDELAGYVENPRHKRAKLLAPTKSGRVALAAIEQSHERWVDALQLEIDGVDWRATRRSLDVLIGALKGMRSDQRG